MNEPLCPTCGRYLNFVQQYNKWHCQNCGAYFDPAPQNPQPFPQQSAQPQQYPQQQGSPQQQQSMVYIQGQQPYQQQQQISPGQGKICQRCGTVNEKWSVTCKSCKRPIS